MNRARIIFVLPFAVCGLAVGCAHKNPATTQFTEADIPRVNTKWDTTQLKVNQQPTAVAQGKTPLVYIFATGGPVRVVDLTSKLQIASTTVAGQTLVRIDDRNGVIAGDQTIAAGPLPTGHEYVIYADPTTENVMRHGIGLPATQPTR